MSEHEFPPKYVTVYTPKPSVAARGNNTEKKTDPQRSFRISDEVFSAISEASELLGVTRSEFIRWIAYDAANQVIGKYKEAQKFQR